MSNPWDNLKGAPPSSAPKNSPTPMSQPIPQPTAQAQPISQPATQSPGQNIAPSGAPSSATASSATASSATASSATASSATASSAFSSPGRLTKPSSSRGTAFLLLAVGLGIMLFDWYLHNSQQGYSVKMALAGPCLSVMGLVGLPFPQALDKDSQDDAVGKIARVAGIGFGLAAGALNWYFLAH